MIEREQPEADGEDGRDLSRRSFLAAASAGAFASAVPLVHGSGTEDHAERAADEAVEFDPARHGFGFRNWRVREGPYPGGDGDTEEEFLDRWDEPFRQAFDSSLDSMPGRLREALARHAREGLLETTRTNGYCYGMVFAAQQYFERPGTLPDEFANASEVVHPEAPLSASETPVLDDVVDYHTAQYLDFYAWFGRYALTRPSWIDLGEELRGLTAAIDRYGTAGITLVSSTSVRSHQVLVYDYDRRRDGVDLAVYDPNYAAATYESRKPTIRIDTSVAEPTVVPIGLNAVYDRFDRFLHNEYDRRIRAGYGDRTSSLTVAPEVLDRVLGRALFVDIGGPVRAVVTDPGGRRIDRTGGSRVLHYRYGASTGTYSLQAIGEGDGEYSIDAYAGGHRGDLFEETIEASIEAGETHRYELTMDDDGTLDRF